MHEDEIWAEYARIQAQADSRVLSDRAWAVDEALEAILDKIQTGQNVSGQQSGNLVLRFQHLIPALGHESRSLPRFHGNEVSQAEH